MLQNIVNYIKITKSNALIELLTKGFNIEEILEYGLKLEKKSGKVLFLEEEKINEIIKSAQALDISIIPFNDKFYPEDLKKIANPPPILYTKGNLELLKKPKFAIIGARFATTESAILAQDFANKLSYAGFTIVSGFAFGVDTFACKGALEYGTIQVLGSGINIIYPKQNTFLYEEVLNKKGLFISELPPCYPVMASNFPLRNRIISGISKAVLLVQASKKNGSSGSLITAKIALEQEKDLFAIPGHPLDEKFKGGNDLIKNGNAIFTTIPEDILDLINYHLKNKPKNWTLKSKNLDIITEEKTTEYEIEDLKSHIKSILSTRPVSVDEIQTLVNVEVKKIQIALIEMEILNEVRKHYNGKFSISLL